MIIKNVTRALFSSVEQLADWQYVSKIHHSLKQNNINQAMRYLINSHLDGTVLDRQTFYNFYLKMSETKVNLSYMELTYKLYRQSFSPHLLMSDWMKGLAKTKNHKLQQLLIKDFQFLNIQMPTIQTIPPTKIPELKIEKKPEADHSNQHSATPEQKLTPSSEDLKTKDNTGLSNSEIQAEIVKLIQSNGLKIVLHDIEFERAEDEYGEEEVANLESLEADKIMNTSKQVQGDSLEDPENMELIMDYLLNSIGSLKLKIGRIEFVLNNSQSSSDPNDDNKDKN